MKDACEPIRKDIEVLQRELIELRDILAEVPSGLKPLIKIQIERAKADLVRLRRALAACEAAKKAA